MKRAHWNRTVRGADVSLRAQVERIKTWRGFWMSPAYARIRRALGKPDAWSVAQPQLEALDARRWRIARRYGKCLRNVRS